ncbi:MAG: ORF6N domain-containing protein, partial [Bacilli bacterium]|nr:ORF6N domain-containing protein [Bacilli bacterium]
MLKLQEKENIIIEDMIYEIRGKQVMLDRDLAKLYQCSNGTKSINLAVKRHINRFPERFMFQLTEYEYKSLRFQLETANNKSRTLPYVFTEQGVAMLATVLRTSVAEEVSIAIMDAFVSMKKYISTNLLEQKYINNQVMKNTEDIKLLQESFKQFDKKRELNEIFYQGQIYDAY